MIVLAKPRSQLNTLVLVEWLCAKAESDAWYSACRNVSDLVICGQGPPPPNPQVVERFQQVISQLFQQVQSLLGRISSITFSASLH